MLWSRNYQIHSVVMWPSFSVYVYISSNFLNRSDLYLYVLEVYIMLYTAVNSAEIFLKLIFKTWKGVSVFINICLYMSHLSKASSIFFSFFFTFILSFFISLLGLVIVQQTGMRYGSWRWWSAIYFSICAVVLRILLF